MTAAPDVVAKELLTATTTVSMRPLFEGNNISFAIGFKHINYLVEAAVLEHFRRAGLPAGELFAQYGLCFELVRNSARLGALLGVDDEAEIEVRPVVRGTEPAIGFKVGIFVQRDGIRTAVASASAAVSLRVAEQVEPTRQLPADLARFVVPRLGTATPTEGVPVQPADNLERAVGRGRGRPDPVLDVLIGDSNAFGWKWRVPYFYCHFNERLQMSGFLRLMEEVVDLFLADRGLPIKSVLDTRGWIPVVTRSEIRLIDEVVMEEEIYVVYTVEDIFKDLLYNSRMDCYVVRDGRAVQVATGTITHGYLAQVRPNEWAMATFDESTRRALANPPRQVAA